VPYDPNRHHRRSIRLKGYDYTQPGAYFVTMVTYERICLFGEIVDGEMRANDYGQIVRDEWFQTAVLRPYVVLHPDEFVVMPNHVHGIIWIVGDDDMDIVGVGAQRRYVGAQRRYVGAQRRCAPTINDAVGGATPTNVIPGSLGAIVRAFKSAVTKRINVLRSTPGAPVWQRNYYEHIIRYGRPLNAIRRYILDNPLRWYLDRENSARMGSDPLAREIWEMLRQDEADQPAGEES